MRHLLRCLLPLAASLAPVDQIKTLLKLGRIDGATGYHELDSGFCNSVYRVDTNKKPVVDKIYSAMAKARCASACRGVVVRQRARRASDRRYTCARTTLWWPNLWTARR